MGVSSSRFPVVTSFVRKLSFQVDGTLILSRGITMLAAIALVTCTEPEQCYNHADCGICEACIAGACEAIPPDCAGTGGYCPPECVACEHGCDACTHECVAAGDSECSGGQARVCGVDSNGCRHWLEWSDCPNEFCADTESCGTCINDCSTIGETECTDGTIRECRRTVIGNDCRAWTNSVPCVTGSCFNGEACDVASTEQVVTVEGTYDVRPQKNSIAVAMDGSVHIAYAIAPTVLRYAVFDGQTWSKTSVDGVGVSADTAGYDPTILVAPVDRAPTIVYGVDDPDNPGRLTRFAQLHNGTWNIETVLVGANTSFPTAFRFDNDGVPSVIVSDRSGDNLHYVRKPGSSWLSLPILAGIEAPIKADHATALRYTTQNVPHFSADYGTYDMYYFLNPASGFWEFPQASTTGEDNLELDRWDYPHFADDDGTYRRFNGFAWDVSTYESSTSALEPAMELDANDRPHIAYRNTNGLNYVWHDGALWQHQLLDDGGISTGRSPDMVIDKTGRTHIVYYDATDGFDLRYLVVHW